MKSFLIIGMGKFGHHMCHNLATLGNELMVVDDIEEKVEDVVAVGDQVIVKVTEIDDQGRINLSRRDALVEINGAVVEDEPEDAPKKDKNRKGFKKHN